MNHYTREDIIRLVEEMDISFIRMQFIDIAGNMKNMAVSQSQIEKALDGMCSFDGAAIEGFTKNEESDLFLHPDLDTFEIFPWRPQQGKVARLICDIYDADGNPYEYDTRHILKMAEAEAEKMGYSLNVGPECEFFLFNTDENGLPTLKTNDNGGYADMSPIDQGENARRDAVLTLEEMGFLVEKSHHETAPAQHEIDFKYDRALLTADNIMTFKLVVRMIAKRYGLHASFMPKPDVTMQGSGMHLNMSLEKDGKNIFEDKTDPNGLSQEAYYFMGGLMKHIRAITCITNPIVNSYKRLVPGFDAPVHVTWSRRNRTSLIRIPAGGDMLTRIELRSPDSAANPYLSIAVCLMAGLDGIRNKIEPPQAVEENTLKLDRETRKKLNIENLPENLWEATEALEEDSFIKEVIGENLADKIVRMSRANFREYNRQVSQWEIEQYLLRV